MRLFV